MWTAAAAGCGPKDEKGEEEVVLDGCSLSYPSFSSSSSSPSSFSLLVRVSFVVSEFQCCCQAQRARERERESEALLFLLLKFPPDSCPSSSFFFFLLLSSSFCRPCRRCCLLFRSLEHMRAKSNQDLESEEYSRQQRQETRVKLKMQIQPGWNAF